MVAHEIQCEDDPIQRILNDSNADDSILCLLRAMPGLRLAPFHLWVNYVLHREIDLCLRDEAGQQISLSHACHLMQGGEGEA